MIIELEKLLNFYDDCYDINSYFYNKYGNVEIMFKRHGVGKRYWTLKVGASGEWRKINVNELASYINAFLDVEKVQADLKNCLKTGAAYAKMVLANYEDFFGSEEVLKSYLDVKAFSDELAKTVEKCLKREKIKIVEIRED